MIAKRLRGIMIVHFLAACGFFYLGIEKAIEARLGFVFGITSLFFIPVAVWIGTQLTKSMSSMVLDGFVVYRDKWHEFRGPYGVHLALYLGGVLVVSLLLAEFLAKFEGESHRLLRDGFYEINSAFVVAIFSAIATAWAVISGMELQWCLGYEKQAGRKLYSKVKEQAGD